MRILVLQHVECEGPGMFAEFMLQKGVAFDQTRLHAGERLPDILPYDALLVMGGPMSVYDELEHPFLAEENRLIKAAVMEGVPVLGVCLGGQLLAKALGAPVVVNSALEIGFDQVELTEAGKKDGLFAGLTDPLCVFQWHGDSFDIPAGGVRLAASEVCANQAFRYGEKAYALQFHLEVTPAMLREWADVYHEDLEKMGRETRKAVLPDDIDRKCYLLRAGAERLFGNFLSLAKWGYPG